MSTLTEDSLVTTDPDAPSASGNNIPSDGAAPGVLPGLPRRRRTGKIAGLSLQIRDQINRMIQEGLPYRLIIEKLQSPGAPALPCVITENNLSDWKDGGYQDWLNDQFWRDEMRARHEAFSSLLAGADPIQLPEAGLQLAALGLCELLRDLSTSGAGRNPDPDKYIRAANCLARLSRSILSLQQYRAACAEAQAKVRELKDPKRKLTEDERRALILQVDEILGIGSYSDTPPNPAPSVAGPVLPGPPATSEPTASPPHSLPAKETGSGNGLSGAARTYDGDACCSQPDEMMPKSISADDPSAALQADSLQPSTEPETEIPEIISAELKTTCEPSLIAPVPNDPMQPTPEPSADAQSVADSTVENQNPKIAEHCLECHTLLPALLPTGGRNSYFCPHCSFPLPPAGSCQLPSLEQCPFCKTNLPRRKSNGERPDDRCHYCGNTLPTPPPNPIPNPNRNLNHNPNPDPVLQ